MILYKVGLQQTIIVMTIIAFILQEHIFNLMKNDSYTRFIRSDQYKDYVNNMKKSRTTPNKISMFAAKQMLMLTNSSAS